MRLQPFSLVGDIDSWNLDPDCRQLEVEVLSQAILGRKKTQFNGEVMSLVFVSIRVETHFWYKMWIAGVP